MVVSGLSWLTLAQMRERVELADPDESVLRTMDTAAEIIGNFVNVTTTPAPILAEAQTRLVGWMLVRNPDGRIRERDDTYSVGYSPAAQNAAMMHSGAMGLLQPWRGLRVKSLGES